MDSALALIVHIGSVLCRRICSRRETTQRWCHSTLRRKWQQAECWVLFQTRLGDIKAAYRIVPVHPEDRHLLAMRWQGGIYIDTALPFGLRSAPKLFNAVADALEWCAKDAGVAFLWHYLDDYITVGRPHTGDCQWNVDVFHHVCERLGIPLAADKCEGPSTCLTFLGIEVDTVKMELRLPAEKLQRL